MEGSLIAPKRWIAHASHDAGCAPHRRTPHPEIRGGGSPVMASSSSRLVTLDGSVGEGGGQVLRTALTLSLLTGLPFRITKIRANRDKPGLRPQHLAAVRAAARLGNADVRGDAIGSRDLTFRPNDYQPEDLTIAIGTAGATALVLQTLHLPIALKADRPVLLTLTGGTFNTNAPSFPFLQRTWAAHMATAGVPVALAMPAAGFYPTGQGRLDAWIEPADRPRPLVLDRREPLSAIRGLAGVANLPGRDIADRMRDRALARFAEAGLDVPIEIQPTNWPGPDRGAALVLEAVHGPITTTFVGLGERGKPAEVVADEAVAELLAFENAPGAGAIDSHTADQLLLPLALAEGRSLFTTGEVTDHVQTNAETIRHFLDTPIRIEEPDDERPGRIIIG